MCLISGGKFRNILTKIITLEALLKTKIVEKVILLESPIGWKDYELLDSGEFEKLERFGEYILIRPEPKALWKRSM